MGRYEEALASFHKTLKLNPKFVQAYNNRGLTYLSLQSYQEALSDFDAALEIFPQFTDVYYNRGNLYKEMGN